MKFQDNSHSVSLGCGTLILIAIIVAIFSSPEMDTLQSDVNRLNDSVNRIQKTLDAQNTSLQEIKELLKSGHRE